MTDCAITVLHARGRRLAKLIHPDFSTTGYDDARTFDAREIGIRDLDHLANVLRELLPLHDRCVVRGSPVHGSSATGIRRLFHPDRKTGEAPTLYELPRRWVAIDVDGDMITRPTDMPATNVAGCARIAVGHLPPEFHGRASIAVATGSHGTKPGIRLRLWFWLDGAATRQVLQPWFYGVQGVDLATFRPVQCIYTAAPVLADGVVDPVPDRLAVLPGESLVPIRAPPSPSLPRAASARPRRPTLVASDRYRDATLAGIEGQLLRSSEGQRHHALIAAATRMFELGGLSDGYIESFIGDAARTLNARGSRQIDANEVTELLEWSRSQASSGKAAA